MLDRLNEDDFLLQNVTLFRDFDTDEALRALKGLLGTIDAWRRQLEEEIERTRSGDFIDSELGYESVYQAAAISHAAVGCIAPFVEGTLAHGFAHLRDDFILPPSLKQHPRWQSGEKVMWCHKYVSRPNAKPQADIVKGVPDLLDALGVPSMFPKDAGRLMGALFCYRNAAFHNGFEWPIGQRRDFKARSEKEAWDNWISWSTSGGELWVAYLTPEFVAACVTLCADLVAGFERVRKHWLSIGWARQIK